MAYPTREVEVLVDQICSAYWDSEKAQAEANAQALIALVGTFTEGDKEYVLRKMAQTLNNGPDWRRAIARAIVVAVRNFG